MMNKLGEMIFSNTFRSEDTDVEKEQEQIAELLKNIKDANTKKVLSFYPAFLNTCKKCPSSEYNCSYTEISKFLVLGMYIPAEEYEDIKSDVISLAMLSDCLSIAKDTPDEWSIQYTFCLA